MTGLEYGMEWWNGKWNECTSHQAELNDRPQLCKYITRIKTVWHCEVKWKEVKSSWLEPLVLYHCVITANITTNHLPSLHKG